MRDLGRTSSALHFADARIDEGARLRPLDLQRFIGVSVRVRLCRFIQRSWPFESLAPDRNDKGNWGRTTETDTN